MDMRLANLDVFWMQGLAVLVAVLDAELSESYNLEFCGLGRRAWSVRAKGLRFGT